MLKTPKILQFIMTEILVEATLFPKSFYEMVDQKHKATAPLFILLINLEKFFTCIGFSDFNGMVLIDPEEHSP